MPIEDIKVAKAPRNWAPNPDQRAAIARDARLQRLNREELYGYFNQPKGQARPQESRPKARPAMPNPFDPRRDVEPGFFESVFGPVIEALSGARK